jgi:YbbR domain-containing protein
MKREKEILSKSPTVQIMRKIYSSIKFNFATKLIFFIIGAALWMNINLQKDFETTIDIPIRLANIARGKTLLHPIPEKARIKIRSKGRHILLSNFSNDLYFEIDGSSFTDSAVIKLNMDYFVNASGKELEPLFIFHPTDINAVYDNLITKKVPVVLNYQFSTAPGYVTSGKLSMIPDSVVVSGPESKVRSIRSLQTKNVFEKDVYLSFSKTLPIALSDSASISYSVRGIQIAQDIVRKGSNTFKAPVRIINKPETMNILLDPIAIDITVTGPVDVLQNITSQNFSVTADARELDNITNRIPVKVTTDIKLEWSHSAREVRAIQY